MTMTCVRPRLSTRPCVVGLPGALAALPRELGLSAPRSPVGVSGDVSRVESWPVPSTGDLRLPAVAPPADTATAGRPITRNGR